MKASTQYNDYKGTAAADVSDYLFIRDYLKDRGVDIERYEPVGFELYTGYSNFVSYRFICKDNYSDENRLVKIGFESKDNISDFLDLFKRFNVVLTWNKSDINYADWEVSDDTIMIDDRQKILKKQVHYLICKKRLIPYIKVLDQPLCDLK